MLPTNVQNMDHWMQAYAPYVMTGVVGVVAVGFVRVAVQAWQDAIKLDREERSMADRLLQPLAARLSPTSDIQVRELRMQLSRAGLRDDNAIRKFSYLRATVLAAAMGIALMLQFSHVTFMQRLIGSLFVLYASVKAPDFYLDHMVNVRQTRIARALPAVIDLMVLCLDVGLSVEAAFERVTSEMVSMEPLMAEEAQLMVGEIGAGLTFPQALKRMSDRVGLDELTTLSRLISQASALGASITQALREYSEASLSKRMLALEEHAGKISAWLVMPLTICLLPASLLALAGPAIVILTQALRR